MAESHAEQPLDAPVISRRRLMRNVLVVAIVSTAAMVVTPIVGFLVPPKTQGAASGGKILVGTTTDIPPGSGKVVAMGNKPVIVVNGQPQPTAFSAICTHLGCIVAWNESEKVIHCPCHDGKFNPNSGAVVSGPPPAPLPAVQVTVEKDQIFLVAS
jgi:cytochrome b6-f complex iron-sulfur subunit